MSAAIVAAMVGLALVVLLLFGAVVELYRQILQLREHVGLVDQARTLDFDHDVRLSNLGLVDHAEVSEDDRYAVLILSDSCSTCGEIAQHLPVVKSRAIVPVLAATSPSMAAEWVKLNSLAGIEIVVDDGSIADRLGVRVTPAVVRFEGEFPVSASTVPSRRQLENVARWLHAMPGERAKDGAHDVGRH